MENASVQSIIKNVVIENASSIRKLLGFNSKFLPTRVG